MRPRTVGTVGNCVTLLQSFWDRKSGIKYHANRVIFPSWFSACTSGSRGRHSRRLACLRSHVLRAYCSFESKQAISITLFGQRSKNNILCKLNFTVSKLQTPHSQECPCHVTNSLLSFNENHGQKYLSRTCLPIPINILILCVPFMGWLAQKLCFSVPCTHQLTQVHLYLSFLFHNILFQLFFENLGNESDVWKEVNFSWRTQSLCYKSKLTSGWNIF